MLKKKIITQYLKKMGPKAALKSQPDPVPKVYTQPAPTPLLKMDQERDFTLSIAIPASIIDNAQSFELKTYLVSQIARAAAIYKVDEIIIVDSRGKYNSSLSKMDPTLFFVRNLGKLTLFVLW